MRAVCLIRKEPYYRRDAFEKGLQRVGFNVVKSFPGTSFCNGPTDWLVMWNRQGGNEALADTWEARGGTVIVAENGYLQKVDKTHYAISVHGHNGSGWFPVGDEDRFTKLGFPLKQWRSDDRGDGKLFPDDYELVCGQRGIGSRTMRSPAQWAEKKVKRLQGQGFKTKLRPHPGNFAPKVPLINDLHGAAACHVWSSAAGIMAIVEGIPTYHSAPKWIGAGAGPITQGLVLRRMAHGQWHHEEIAAGEPFARVIAERGKASW